MIEVKQQTLNKKMIRQKKDIFSKVSQQKLKEIIKLYVKHGPDYQFISKQFFLIMEQKITPKFVEQFCFQINKQSYKIMVEFLKTYKDQKGQKQINYQNLWPQNMTDPQVKSQISYLPSDLLRINKDLSEAYNLLMQNYFNPALNMKKLVRYDRIRDLYTLVGQIILKKNKKIRRQKRQKKQPGKEGIKDDSSRRQNPKKRGPKANSQKKQKQKKDTQQKNEQPNQNQWSQQEERFLCLLYLERSLYKCCQKLKQKFGDNQKWNTTKKVYKKAQEIFQRTLKRVIRSSQIKDVLAKLKMDRENLIADIINKKTNDIQSMILKYYQEKKDAKKRAKNTKDIEKFIQKYDQIVPQKQMNKQQTEQQIVKKLKSQNQKEEPKKEEIIKEENKSLNQDKGQQIKLQESDQNKQVSTEEIKQSQDSKLFQNDHTQEQQSIEQQKDEEHQEKQDKNESGSVQSSQ